jgi:hypothetical protein
MILPSADIGALDIPSSAAVARASASTGRAW